MKGKEAIYTIPLSKAYEKPRKRRAKTAVKELRKFVKRHAKVDNENVIKISNSVNALIWFRSIEKPPRKVKVKVVIEDPYVYVLLPEQKLEEVVKKEQKETKEEKKEEKKSKKETKEKKEEKPEKSEEKKEEKKEVKETKEKKEAKKDKKEEKESKKSDKKEEKKEEKKQ